VCEAQEAIHEDFTNSDGCCEVGLVVQAAYYQWVNHGRNTSCLQHGQQVARVTHYAQPE